MRKLLLICGVSVMVGWTLSLVSAGEDKRHAEFDKIELGMKFNEVEQTLGSLTHVGANFVCSQGKLLELLGMKPGSFERAEVWWTGQDFIVVAFDSKADNARVAGKARVPKHQWHSIVAGATAKQVQAPETKQRRHAVILPAGEPEAKKTLYTIQWTYVEQGRDGKEQCIAAPTLRTVDGRCVSFRWDSSGTGEKHDHGRSLYASMIPLSEPDGTVRIEIEVQNSTFLGTGENVSHIECKVHAHKTTKPGEVLKFPLGGDQQNAADGKHEAKAWLEVVVKEVVQEQED